MQLEGEDKGVAWRREEDFFFQERKDHVLMQNSGSLEASRHSFVNQLDLTSNVGYLRKEEFNLAKGRRDRKSAICWRCGRLQLRQQGN